MEFTGERVIPGQVEPDLWAEHFSRYRFAANLAKRLARPLHILDIGCGSGYGTATLAEVASGATGLDLATEAIEYARANYSLPHLNYVPGSATDLPFEADSFDLITAFEVIEHLKDPLQLLAEARRVLRPNGVFLVSTPNKTYYAETRRDDGPNPYHLHEFTFDEFTQAIATHFPSSTTLLQNHTDAFSFYDPKSPLAVDGYLETVAGTPTDAHFFLAVCSAQPVPELHNFVYVPAATNLLRTREHHIDLLQREIQELKTSIDAVQAALRKAHEERDSIVRMFDEQGRELNERTAWALQTDNELKQRLVELKSAYAALTIAENTVIERTRWAKQLETEVHASHDQIRHARDSRWMRLGRKLKLGPHIEVPKQHDARNKKDDPENNPDV